MLKNQTKIDVIAEIGVNHNGDLALAREMVSAAADCGAHTVKFQAFTVSGLVSDQATTAKYQSDNTGQQSQAEMLRQLALPMEAFETLSDHCNNLGVEFLCTAFEPELTQPLLNLGMKRIKVPSGELDNIPFLSAWGAFGLPVLLSTGMGHLDEVIQACNVLEEAGADDITVLHCTSLYPAAPDTVNLKAIETIASATGRPVGYSDHTNEDHVAIGAVALGATVIEKHFTTDRSLPGPDQKASMEPAEFAEMVRKLDDVHMALGTGIKQPHPDEADTAAIARRSWHAVTDLQPGQPITADSVKLVRPQGGLPPSETPAGKTVKQFVPAGSPVEPGAVD